MKSTCPKCHAKIELDIPYLPDEGTTVNCTLCKGRFHLFKESFARRAFRRTGEISCVQCGNELGPGIHCPVCGALYPEYYVSSTEKKRVLKIKEIRERPADRRGKARGPVLPWSEQRADTTQDKEVTFNKHGKLLPLAISLVAVIALAITGARFYNQYKAEQRYAKIYITKLFVINSGKDLCIKTCVKIAADWKTKSASGVAVTPRISGEDAALLDKANLEITTVMQKNILPPKKYITSDEDLAKLYGIYQRSYQLATVPSGTLAGYTDSFTKLDTDFKQAAQLLKANMPERLSQELLKGYAKFKGLKEL